MLSPLPSALRVRAHREDIGKSGLAGAARPDDCHESGVERDRVFLHPGSRTERASRIVRAGIAQAWGCAPIQTRSPGSTTAWRRFSKVEIALQPAQAIAVRAAGSAARWASEPCKQGLRPR